MSETIILAIISGVITVVLAIFTFISLKIQLKNNIIIAQISSRQDINALHINDKVDEYHKEVNGKMTKLLETTEALGKAKGKAEEKGKTKTVKNQVKK